MHRQLRNAVERRRRLDTRKVEQRRHDVDRVMKLRADLAAAGEACFPRDDERRADAAGVRVLLVAAQRRVADLRPALRIIGLAARAADGVEACPVELEARLMAVLVRDDVGRAASAAFLARAVVRHHDEDRVVVAAGFLQAGDEPRELVVGVIDHRGERFLQPRRDLLLVRRQRIPRGHAIVAPRIFGILRDDAERELPLEAAAANHVPAFVVLSAILVEERLRRLVRAVRGAERHVQEERPLARRRNLVADEPDRVIDQVGGQVIAFLR